MLHGINSHTSMTGYDGDISALFQFVWYEWCYFREQKELYLFNNKVLGVETCVPKKIAQLATTVPSSTNHCGRNHVTKHDTSLPNVLVRHKAASYLMAAKGLLNKVNNKVNRMDHFIQLT